MPEPTSEPIESSDTSVIIKALKRTGLLEKLVTYAAVALVGGSASVATKKVTDANDLATLEQTKTELARVEAEFKKFRETYYERQRENRERADADHKEIERETRQSERYLERRLTRIETRLGIEAPPAAAAAPVEEPPRQ